MANISIDVADNEARQDLQDLEDYVDSAAFDKQSLSVSQNGTYTAPAGKAYSPVVVDVPNTYTQSDEGKVVSSGALVSQTTRNVTTNGTYDTTTNNSVVVDVQGQPSIVLPKAVNFYDYDGTIIQSYSAAEFAELTEMPENPTHDGLTAQGWNWSLADAKTYVASYGKLNIGQMYITDDGATRLHIRLADGRLSPVLGLCPNGTLTIDWGDETPAETMTGTSTSTLVYLSHIYSQAGEYTISIMPTSGSTFAFGERNSASTVLCKSDSDTLTDRRIYLNTMLNINLGDGITSIDDFAFFYCYSLSSITIPNSVMLINNKAFQSCISLSSITIPNSVTTIGSNAFYNGYVLSSITIPNSVTTIGSNAFNNGYVLSSITIPNSVTTIGSNAFTSCISLSSITIPNSVTTIDSQGFANCHGLGYLKFTNTTPPAVNTNAFYGILTECIIYVPEGSLTAYTSASNYPSPSKYTYVEY